MRRAGLPAGGYPGIQAGRIISQSFDQSNKKAARRPLFLMLRRCTEAVRRTEIVSRGFAARAGRFPLAENIPYAKERPWAKAHSDGAQNSKKRPEGRFFERVSDSPAERSAAPRRDSRLPRWTRRTPGSSSHRAAGRGWSAHLRCTWWTSPCTGTAPHCRAGGLHR